MPRFRQHLPLIAILLVGFGLRFINLDSTPPGYRDDTLINIYTMTQHILDGDWTLFFPDASGHEFLYHAFAAIHVKLFGHTALGMRGLSVWQSLLTIALTYAIGRKLHSRQTGLIAAAALTVSFWSLMYARFGLRHVQMPVFMLLAFYFFLSAIGRNSKRRYFIYTAIYLALGIHTYFAAYGMPMIIVAYCVWLFLFQRQTIRQHGRNLLLMLGLTALLIIPIITTIITNPRGDDDGRVAEISKPVTLARDGDFSLVIQYTQETLRMFHNFGDSENLYNIPLRPVFGWPLAFVFFIGVALMLWFTISAIRKPQPRLAHAPFMLLWLMAGLAPAFLSVPSASLSHTIAAQPIVYILFALPAGFLLAGRKNRLLWLLPALLIVGVASRDLPAYFVEWPQLARTRFLYRADIREAARYVNQQSDFTEFGISGLLAGPWDKIAFETDVMDSAEPRWFNPSRAILLQTAAGTATNLTSFPAVPELYTDLYTTEIKNTDSGYNRRQISRPIDTSSPIACFVNGLCLVDATYTAPLLDVTWHVATPLQLPPIPLVSNPPPPNVYAGLRLSSFTHLWNSSGERLTGDDGFWLDPETLQSGDVFRQQHILIPPDGTATTIAIGLYDPKTGDRILTQTAADHVAIPLP